MDWPADGDLVFVPARPAPAGPAGPGAGGGRWQNTDHASDAYPSNAHSSNAHPSHGGPVPAVELRRLRETGEPVGLAFTSVESLVAVLGPWQPWISVPMFSYVAFLRTQGVRRVEVDPLYRDDVRDWSGQRVVHAVEMHAAEMHAADVNTAEGA